MPDDFFSKSFASFSKTSFRNPIRVSNGLDPDQARRFVGPDLGPNCLQRLSADDTSRKKVTFPHFFRVFEEVRLKPVVCSAEESN